MPALHVTAQPLPPTRITLDGDMEAIRQGLAQLFQMQPLCDLDDDGRGTAEIVLAEVLNNIVEHAYADHPGLIRVEVQRRAADILCRIRDDGHPMPGGTPPAGTLEPIDADDPPEGGFGWFLIRAMVRDLTYSREGRENVLAFCLETP